ncbi:MAG: AI-2E family transporter [Coraliomargarita sp.]|nr:AI-2E family transporter [Coraliomargarita sp.]
MPNDGPLTFTPFQKRIIAAAGTALGIIVLLATAFYTFQLLRSFVSTFQDVLLPLAIAAILATLLRPIISFVETRTRLSKVQGIILLYLLVMMVCGVIVVGFLPFALEQTAALIKHLPTLQQSLLAQVQSAAPEAWAWLGEKLGMPPDEYLKDVLANNTENIGVALSGVQSGLGTIGGLFGGLFGKVATYSIIPIYLFFLLNSDRNVWSDIDGQLSFLPDSRREDLVFLARQFSEILVSFFRGQIIIGLLLGVVLAAGFGLVGLKFGILLGIFLGLLNIIPYLGTMIGILTVLPMAFYQEGGGLPLIGLCAVVFVIGQLLTDYVFTPRIMGDKTGMGPMLIIFSIFFWGTALGGILGMVLAIPLTAFFLVFWRLARQKYLPALIQQQQADEAPQS